MSWRWDWYDWEGRRPLLATIICVCVLVFSGRSLLRAFHLLHPLSGLGPVDHILLRAILKVAEPVLHLLGATFLWQMRPIAWILRCATFFASEVSPMLTGISPN